MAPVGIGPAVQPTPPQRAAGSQQSGVPETLGPKRQSVGFFCSSSLFFSRFSRVCRRVPEQEAVSSLLRQGALCLEARGAESLGLAECRGLGSGRPHSQVAPLGGARRILARRVWRSPLIKQRQDSQRRCAHTPEPSQEPLALFFFLYCVT